MRMKWLGNIREVKNLPKGNLPDKAVQFKEPDSALKLNLTMLLFVIPLFLFSFFVCMIKLVLFGEVEVNFFNNLWVWVAIIPMFIVHELLHAIAFPSDEEPVGIGYSSKYFVAFAYSNVPVTKGRFIFISILPNLILGVLPIIIWIFIPNGYVADSIFCFAIISLVSGAGDLMNVWNAWIQMPKGALTQLSGFHSYWYMP